MFCTRCIRPFSYAVPRSDNKDQALCVECCAHLRAGGAWERLAAPRTNRRVKNTESAMPPFRSTLMAHVQSGCRRIHCPVCG
jgi:hypothetical protein